MSWLGRIWSSIVVKVTVLTMAWLMMMFAGFLMLMQTSVLTQFLYPRALSDSAESIAELVWLLEASPDAIDPFILSVYEGGYRSAVISSDFASELQSDAKLQAYLVEGDSDVAVRLAWRDIRFQSLGFFQLQRRLREEGAQSMRVTSGFQIAIDLSDGRILNIWLAPALTLSRQPAAFVTIGVIVLLLCMALGLAIAAVTLRPIRQLEQDAAEIELGGAGTAISETGPAELRRISAALNRMRERLSMLIREREQMVAAIAHDFRTGLTRIRLRMDERGAVSADEIESDIAQMEALITDMLAYARAESPSGPRELIRLDEFVVAVAEAAFHPIMLSVPQDGDFTIIGDLVALRRLFENLIENARRYGGGEISVRLVKVAEGREVIIEDNGPGLPEEQLETVFQPFQRGESSRNRDTGGTGLGLGIARAIARAHGAKLRIENRAEGGLAAIVLFPESLKT